MNTEPAAAPARPGRFARWFPGLVRLREYQLAWLRPDLVAGITLAAYLLPAGIADASLAGLSPEAGLYAYLFSGLVFWLFCSRATRRSPSLRRSRSSSARRWGNSAGATPRGWRR